MQERSKVSPLDSAQRALRESAYQPLRKLTCSYREGVLTIAGRVPSFFLKQLAQTALRDLDGVTQIDNRIEVGR